MFFKSLALLILSFTLWLGGLVWFIEDMPQGTPDPSLKTEFLKGSSFFHKTNPENY